MKELWCEAFGLNEADYAALKKATPSGMSLLHYGFQSKKLDFEVYKSWIQKKVNMPFLNESVFKEKSTLAEIQLYCKKHQMHLIEGHESLIFYSNGTMKYVACFYPKALPHIPKTEVHYVLVSPESLAKLRELARMKPILPSDQLKKAIARMNSAFSNTSTVTNKVSAKAPPKAPAPKSVPVKTKTNAVKVKSSSAVATATKSTPTRPTRNISAQPAMKNKTTAAQNKKKLG